MNGGGVPGGSCRSCVCDDRGHLRDRGSMFAPGWKKTLTTAMPRSDCDSMCSMSLTVVVSDALVDRDDPRRHLLGGQAAVVPDDRDDRDVDVREDVGRRPRDGERPDHQDQQRQHDERVRPS